MEFLKTIKRRSFLNEVIYVALNVSLAIALMLIIQTTGSLLLAFALVLISFWRVFAVRPRFWYAHLESNLVSIIVSVSYVVFLYSVNLTNVGDFQVILLRLVLAMLYIGWLLFLKPQSKRVYIVAQSGVALFSGVTAIYILSYGWIATPVVLLMWLIGYATASHILGSYDEEAHSVLLSIIWGLLASEIGWLAYHWTIAYRMPILANVLVPQVSIVMLSIGFVVYKSYDSYYHHQKIRMNDILLPLIFSASVITVLVLAFNGLSSGVV